MMPLILQLSYASFPIEFAGQDAPYPIPIRWKPIEIPYRDGPATSAESFDFISQVSDVTTLPNVAVAYYVNATAALLTKDPTHQRSLVLGLPGDAPIRPRQAACVRGHEPIVRPHRHLICGSYLLRVPHELTSAHVARAQARRLRHPGYWRKGRDVDRGYKMS